MAKKQKIVKYLSVKKDSLSNEIVKVGFKSLKIESEGVKRYFNTIAHLFKLSKSDRLLLDFIVERMDGGNVIANSIKFRNDFGLLLKKVNSPTYSKSTIHKGFSNLVREGILIRHDKRALFYVNPKFYFKGTEQERIKLIREILERDISADAKGVRKAIFHKKPSYAPDHQPS